MTDPVGVSDQQLDWLEIADALDGRKLPVAADALRAAVVEVSRLQAEWDHAATKAQEWRGNLDAAEARVAAVEKLLNAAEEASLRPEPEDFEPIEVPWTVAVRAALSATPGEDGKR